MGERRHTQATIAIPQSTLPDGAPISGHRRVWSSVRAELETLSVLDHSGSPDVWFYSAHGGPPEVDGPSVAVAYEAGWTVPGAYVGYPEEYLRSIDDATRKGVAHADAVVVGAESAKHELISAYGLREDLVHVVPFGVDLNAFNPRHLDEAMSIPQLASLLDRPYVAFVNSLAPRKNVHLVRQAVEQLLREGYPHRLVMVASAAKHLGGDVDAIERAAFAPFADFDHSVIRLEKVSDDVLAAMLAAASALCAPSSHEGFGLTVLEAMASGTPVVAARRGALGEVVGSGGILVEPEVAELVAGLKVILDDHSDHWRECARTQAEQFPWSRTAKGWSEVADLVKQSTKARRRWFSRLR